MDLKRITSSLLFKIVVAIILGIACSFFFPVWLARVFATFNGLFGNFLGFFVPVLIFALITPAIAGLGRASASGGEYPNSRQCTISFGVIPACSRSATS